MDALTADINANYGDVLPIFTTETVDMRFGIASDFVAAQAANNVLILALQNGRLLRIDLGNPEEVDDVDLPRKAQEVGIIRRMFLDPTASHLIINTTLNENFYLHTQSRTPKQLSKLRGIPITSITWNSSAPTASTREILIGAADGQVWEAFIDPSSEFLRREEKYAKLVYRADGPVTGIWADQIPGKPDMRRILISTPSRLSHFVGRLGRHGAEGSGSIFNALFERESPTVFEPEAGSSSRSSALAVTPEPPDSSVESTPKEGRIFAWLYSQGVFHGELLLSPASSDLGRKCFDAASTLDNAPLLEGTNDATTSSSFVALTQWHVLQLFGRRLIASNRLDGSKVYDSIVLDEIEKPLSLMADLKMNTFWLFTSKQILEIRVENEDRDIWKILLKDEKFEEALQYANNSAQKDTVATASGDYLIKKGKYLEAASVYGKSSKPFEDVALRFIDTGQKDALRKYLTTRLAALKKSMTMQRIMLASWLIEVFMSKLNSLDDIAMAKTEDDTSGKTVKNIESELATVRREFQEFVRRYKDDIDRKTAYTVISSHGREEELLFFATAVSDYNYVLSYWCQREKWTEALRALNRQTDPDIIYKYSSVLMASASVQFVDILMRQDNVQARKIIPAFLNYNNINQDLPLRENQAARYLMFEINQRLSNEAAVHNTLISIYASHPSPDETLLLDYLESQSAAAMTRDDPTSVLPYDVDFALRLCAQHSRVRSCVVIYTTLSQFSAAVDLALQHNEIDIAIAVAERPEHDHASRKKLWIAIARAVISGSADPPAAEAADPKELSTQPKGLAHKSSQKEAAGIAKALTLMRRAPTGILRIEDLLPLFPDFVLIDAFKDEICAALESYSSQIDNLKQEMDDSAATAARIRSEVDRLDQRWVLLEPGESCALCGQVLLDRRFWVWSCGHGAHGDCVAREIVKYGSKSASRRVREVRNALEAGAEGKRREGLVKELDDVVGRECPLCGDLAVRMLDEPFVSAADDKASWTL